MGHGRRARAKRLRLRRVRALPHRSLRIFSRAQRQRTSSRRPICSIQRIRCSTRPCVLTGELLKLSDREAMQRIADCGGKNADNVTKKTDLLIVGGGSPREKKSGKVRKAEEYIEKGIPIQIISEEEFLQM